MVISRGMRSKTLMRNRRPAPGKKDGDPTKTSRCIPDAKTSSFSVAFDVLLELWISISLNPLCVVVHCNFISASEPVRRRHVPFLWSVIFPLIESREMTYQSIQL